MADQSTPGDMIARTYRMAFGFVTSQVVSAAARLGIPDALAAGASTVDELARATGTATHALRRLVRALVVLGVLTEVEPDRVGLSPQGQLLRSDHPRSVHPSLLLFGHPAVWQAWGGLADSVRSGTTAFEHVHGQPLFPHLAQDAELSEVFHAAMRSSSQHVGPQLTAAYDVTGADTVVDVGGGNGALIAAVLQAAPTAHGILYDTADGLAGAPELLRSSAVADRCRLEVGDFFQHVPSGDLVLMKGVLHDWDDERCVTLLSRCRSSIAAGGRLLVLEPVLPAGTTTPEAASAIMSDVAMLVYTGGRERTEADFRTLLTAGGFALEQITPRLAGSDVHVLVARPA